MTATEIISLVTSIAACLSAVAALAVVYQNYKQRTASYRPELVLVKTTVELQSFEKAQGVPRVTNANNSSHHFIPIVNVGLGAARDLKISWKFPVDKLVSLANRHARSALNHAYFEYRSGFLSMKKSETQMQWTIHWRAEREAEIDYILPAPMQGSQTNQLRLPMTYVLLVAGIHHLVFEARPSEWPDIPPLECRLEYSDIGGAKHDMDVLIQMTMSMIGTDGSEFVIQCEPRNA